MYKFKVTFLGLMIAFGINNTVLAQGEAAVPFLLIAPDSRGSGIG